MRNQTPLTLHFGEPWDLHAIKPTFFPVPPSVVTGQRAQDDVPTPLPTEVDAWKGKLPQVNLGWEKAAPYIARLFNPAVKYNGETDFTHIGLVGDVPLVLVASPKSGLKSAPDALRVVHDHDREDKGDGEGGGSHAVKPADRRGQAHHDRRVGAGHSSRLGQHPKVEAALPGRGPGHFEGLCDDPGEQRRTQIPHLLATPELKLGDAPAGDLQARLGGGQEPAGALVVANRLVKRSGRVGESLQRCFQGIQQLVQRWLSAPAAARR